MITVTASMPFSLSSIWRKSLYFVALSNRVKPSAARAQSTSASATMFSELSDPRTLPARPPAPTPAMFIFSFGDW